MFFCSCFVTSLASVTFFVLVYFSQFVVFNMCVVSDKTFLILESFLSSLFFKNYWFLKH
jgi:hypothetical protein